LIEVNLFVLAGSVGGASVLRMELILLGEHTAILGDCAHGSSAERVTTLFGAYAWPGFAIFFFDWRGNNSCCLVGISDA